MPISPNFSTTQSLSTLGNVSFVDTSTGSDVGLTSRRIYVRLANGNWLTSAGESTTEAYETWPIADTSITVSLLNKSTTANVTVKWMTGSSVTEELPIMQEWDLYDYVFLYGLLSNQTSSPARVDNQGYWQDSFKMITNLFQSETAVTDMSSLAASQAALDRNQEMIDNQSKYF